MKNKKGLRNENKINAAIAYLVVCLNIDITDKKEFSILLRAIDYANLDYFTDNPSNLKESIMKEIFTTSASGYFSRKHIKENDVKMAEYTIQIHRIKMLTNQLHGLKY